ncbi:hypothetical protein D3C79_835660 [compost metagenome]
MLEAADEVAGGFDRVLQHRIGGIHLVKHPVRIEVSLGDQLLDPLLTGRLLQLAHLGVGLGIVLFAQGLVVVLATAGLGLQTANAFEQAAHMLAQLGIVDPVILFGFGDLAALGLDLLQLLAQWIVRVCHGMLLLLGPGWQGPDDAANSACCEAWGSIIIRPLSEALGLFDHLLRPFTRP